MRKLLTAVALMAATPAISGTCTIISAHAVPSYMSESTIDVIDAYEAMSNTIESFMVGTSYPDWDYEDTYDVLMENLNGTMTIVEEFTSEDNVMQRATITTIGELPRGVIYVILANCGKEY